MLRVFIGYDTRQPIAYNVLQSSIVRHSSKPVAITPLILSQLPIKRRGLTEFTFSRFLVPYLCEYSGFGLFLDADMVVTGDIAELFACADSNCNVQVVKDQHKFEWGSAMLFNCSRCGNLTTDFISDTSNKLLDLKWANVIGELPKTWNQIIGYGPAQPSNLYHFTRGIPIWPETKGNGEDAIWWAEAKEANSSCSYQELMGNSVHELTRNANN